MNRIPSGKLESIIWTQAKIVLLCLRQKTMARPTVLSTFTGPGGLDLGLERAHFRVAGCIEIDPLVQETLRKNRPTWPVLEPGDIRAQADRLKPKDLGLRRRELGLLVGGPPCQPFSKAAQWAKNGRSGLTDNRADGLRAFLRIVEVFLPQAILIENVPGFVQGETNAVPFLERELDRINRRERTRYGLEAKVLDAAGYGVPQRRRRAIVIVFRNGQSFEWPVPTHHDKPVRAWDAIGGLSCRKVPPAKGYWAGLLPSIPEGQNYLWHTRRNGGERLFGYRTRYWSFLLKLAKNQPSWTLSAHPGPATGPFHWKNRPLTVKEMLRLQSFPATWHVAGEYRHQVFQVGNATPPLLGEVLGRAIASQLFGAHFEGPPTLRIARKRSVPQPERVRRVPERYLRHRGPHADHPGPGQGPGSRT